MKENNQSFNSIMKTVKYAIRFVWKKNKNYLYIKVLSSIFNSIIPLVSVLMPGFIINEIYLGKRFEIVIVYVLIYSFFPLVIYLINALFDQVLNKQLLELNVDIQSTFYYYISNLDYETLEQPIIQDKQRRACDTINSVPGIIDGVFRVVTSVIKIFFMGSLILTLNPLIVAMIIIVVIVNSRAIKWLNHKQFEINKRISLFSRFVFTVNTMITSFYFAKENRLYDMFPTLIQKFANNSRKNNKMKEEMYIAQRKAGFVPQITGAIQNITTYIYLIYNVFKGKMLIGDLNIYMSAVGQLSNAISSAMTSFLAIGRQSQNVLEMIDFMNLPLCQSRFGSLKPIFKSNSLIEFKNVSFKYPGNDRYVLKNINIKIHGDEKLCLVGQNGAGKTTFVKLLVRLYSPTEGEILLNGVNINQFNYEEYLQLFSPIFQDFCFYYSTFKENITMSKDICEEDLHSVINRVGFSSLIEKLPKHEDTQIGKMIEDDGINLSGGEGQRLAIARALYHNRPIFILDEPTAALDPNAEYEIYTQFNDIITDKCAVLITHRLSAVQLADKVAVFDDGQIAEYGTHAELYAKGGIYTEMFDKQAQFYRDEAPATENAQG